MSNPFFDRPILNSPYEYPSRHWELDAEGQPTQQVIEKRRSADFITPIPKPNTQGVKVRQASLDITANRHFTVAKKGAPKCPFFRSSSYRSNRGIYSA
ncbi:MAG TPA: hypothetical protein DCM64_06010 [Gammaproteobacteria bacterium]|nr:hypothetical protein [Gammaproteobacteria bacterium]